MATATSSVSTKISRALTLDAKLSAGQQAEVGHQRSVDDPGEIVDNLRGLAWLREVANALPPSANLSSEVAMPLPLVNGRNRRARIGLITTSHPSP
jgi:hypothetical protein